MLVIMQTSFPSYQLSLCVFPFAIFILCTLIFGFIYLSPPFSAVLFFYAPATKSDRWSRMVVVALDRRDDEGCR